jgi:hypothetical protein
VTQPSSPSSIQVELFGVPRLLTGERVVAVPGRTLGEVAAALTCGWPELCGTVLSEQGWLLGGYTFVVDECFTRDPEQVLAPDAEVLLVTSVAGG